MPIFTSKLVYPGNPSNPRRRLGNQPHGRPYRSKHYYGAPQFCPTRGKFMDKIKIETNGVLVVNHEETQNIDTGSEIAERDVIPTRNLLLKTPPRGTADSLPELEQIPCTTEEWARIEKGFRGVWDFPGCFEAKDGKHINIIRPAGSGCKCFNCKSHFNTVLLAVVDDKYCFSYFIVVFFNDSPLKDILEKILINFASWGII
ncbi:hypothetical protein JTB14_023127 [Gonioctena quinquepunctata]|nr:hypothetical protein JTB14_023127 [Gonioctena quinquepunctata]